MIFLMNFRIPRRRITSGRERVGLKKVVIVVSNSKALRFTTSSSPILFCKIFPNCAVLLVIGKVVVVGFVDVVEGGGGQKAIDGRRMKEG